MSKVVAHFDVRRRTEILNQRLSSLDTSVGVGRNVLGHCWVNVPQDCTLCKMKMLLNSKMPEPVPICRVTVAQISGIHFLKFVERMFVLCVDFINQCFLFQTLCQDIQASDRQPCLSILGECISEWRVEIEYIIMGNAKLFEQPFYKRTMLEYTKVFHHEGRIAASCRMLQWQLPFYRSCDVAILQIKFPLQNACKRSYWYHSFVCFGFQYGLYWQRVIEHDNSFSSSLGYREVLVWRP